MYASGSECCVISDPKMPVVRELQEAPPSVSTNPIAVGRDAESSGVRSSVQSQSNPPRGNLWLGRIRALLFVTLCATFGVLLLILPWTSRWTDNPWLLSFPQLRDFVSSGFVRGLSSGLGLLNLWLGFAEAIHYHENPS
jgi:hypothetical protein